MEKKWNHSIGKSKKELGIVTPKNPRLRGKSAQKRKLSCTCKWFTKRMKSFKHLVDIKKESFKAYVRGLVAVEDFMTRKTKRKFARLVK